jgi:hypothetical protein
MPHQYDMPRARRAAEAARRGAAGAVGTLGMKTPETDRDDDHRLLARGGAPHHETDCAGRRRR